MKSRALMMGLALVIVAFVTGQSFGETLEEFEKKIVENMSKHKFISYKMKTVANMDTPDAKFKSNSESVLEIAGRGKDKWVSRLEAKTTTERKVGDQKEQKEESKVLAIYDGEYSYTYSEAGDQKTAMKTKVDINANPFNGKSMFDEIRKNFVIKLLPDETVDGKSVNVIQTTYKPRDSGTEDMGATRTLTYYNKDNGVPVKSVAYEKDGKVSFTMTVSDVKIDEEIKPERFVFKVPAGVKVQDMTQTETQPAEETAEQPAPAPEEKAENEKKADAEPKAEPKAEEKPKKKGIGGLLKKLK